MSFVVSSKVPNGVHFYTFKSMLFLDLASLHAVVCGRVIVST